MSQEKSLLQPLVKEMVISGHQEGICLKKVADLTGKEPSTLQSIIKKWEETSGSKGVHQIGPLLFLYAFFSPHSPLLSPFLFPSINKGIVQMDRERICSKCFRPAKHSYRSPLPIPKCAQI